MREATRPSQHERFSDCVELSENYPRIARRILAERVFKGVYLFYYRSVLYRRRQNGNAGMAERFHQKTQQRELKQRF